MTDSGTAQVNLPSGLFSDSTRPFEKVSVLVYENEKLFPSKLDDVVTVNGSGVNGNETANVTRYIVNSQVISASVLGRKVQGLKDPVKIEFKHNIVSSSSVAQLGQ